MNLSAGAEETSPIGSLLMDIFIVFTMLRAERLLTRTLLQSLNRFADRPWAQGRRGKDVTDLWLAARLRPYGIRPTSIRLGELVGRGYAKEDFLEAWRRYIPLSEVQAPSPRAVEMAPPEASVSPHS